MTERRAFKVNRDRRRTINKCLKVFIRLGAGYELVSNMEQIKRAYVIMHLFLRCLLWLLYPWSDCAPLTSYSVLPSFRRADFVTHWRGHPGDYWSSASAVADGAAWCWRRPWRTCFRSEERLCLKAKGLSKMASFLLIGLHHVVIAFLHSFFLWVKIHFLRNIPKIFSILWLKMFKFKTTTSFWSRFL